MLLFQTSREILFYFQHFIQVCFYFLGKKLGGAPLAMALYCMKCLYALTKLLMPNLMFQYVTIKWEQRRTDSGTAHTSRENKNDGRQFQLYQQPKIKDMITFKFWLFIFCRLFEIKTFLLILQTSLTFAMKHGADGALPGCITRYSRYQICIPLRYFKRITHVACHLQTWESEQCESNTIT